jgi:hypothetical protein
MATLDLGAVTRANWESRGCDVVLTALLNEEKISVELTRRLLLESCYAFRRLHLRDVEARAMLTRVIALLGNGPTIPALVTEHPALPVPEKTRSTAIGTSASAVRATIAAKPSMTGPAGKLPG